MPFCGSSPPVIPKYGTGCHLHHGACNSKPSDLATFNPASTRTKIVLLALPPENRPRYRLKAKGAQRLRNKTCFFLAQETSYTGARMSHPTWLNRRQGSTGCRAQISLLLLDLLRWLNSLGRFVHARRFQRAYSIPVSWAISPHSSLCDISQKREGSGSPPGRNINCPASRSGRKRIILRFCRSRTNL